MWQTLVVLCKGKQNKKALTHYAEDLLNEQEKTDDNTFNIFRWDVEDSYWDFASEKVARSIDSVVLPQDTKQKILTDMDEFLTRATYAWYTEHGIPYKRSYLFYGVPGGGKTSLLQALSGDCLGKYAKSSFLVQRVGGAVCFQHLPIRAANILNQPGHQLEEICSPRRKGSVAHYSVGRLKIDDLTVPTGPAACREPPAPGRRTVRSRAVPPAAARPAPPR